MTYRIIAHVTLNLTKRTSYIQTNIWFKILQASHDRDEEYSASSVEYNRASNNETHISIVIVETFIPEH